MKISSRSRQIIIEIISYLYILLFVYAAVSKLSEFENFQAELGQSPLLSAFTGWVSVVIPAAELLIALLLAFPKFRLIALYLAFSMMVMFTAYIIIVLNFSAYVPCSCGGILGKLGWTAHLVFNIFFTVMALAAIILMLIPCPSSKPATTSRKIRARILGITLIIVSNVGLVVILHATSEGLIHKDNPFIRSFNSTAIQSGQTVLPNNNYYFAGKADGKIYLGNSEAPLYVTEIDTLLKKRKRYKINLDNYDYPFRNIELQVIPPYFYLFDGSVPVVFQGKITDWTGHAVRSKFPYFSSAVVVDSVNVAFRGENQGREYVLGQFDLKGTEEPVFMEGLLRRQIDGFFDSDGMLKYDREQKKLLYLYYYRNQFLVMDNKLALLYEGKTIDTISKAKLKVAYLKERGERKLAAPPTIVNVQSTAADGLLYVNSAIPGRFEDKEMWKQASIVDIYNITDNTYRSSIYIYKAGELKMNGLMAYGSKLYVLLGYHLHCYSLNNK